MLFGWAVRDGEEIARPVVCPEEPHDIVKTKRAGAATAKDGDLITALISGAVAVEAF